MDPTPKLDPFQLCTSLAATLGEQGAAAVVSSITRNDDSVTKDHFDVRLAEMNTKLDTGFAQADAKLKRSLPNLTVWMVATIIAANTALTSIIIAVPH